MKTIETMEQMIASTSWRTIGINPKDYDFKTLTFMKYCIRCVKDRRNLVAKFGRQFLGTNFHLTNDDNYFMVRKWVESHRNLADRGLLVMGKVRTGKSSLLAALAMFFCQQKDIYCYHTPQKILEMMDSNEAHRSFNFSRYTQHDIIMSKPYHFIDDLNLNFANREVRRLASFIDDLIVRKARIFVATNANKMQIEKAKRRSNEWARIWGRIEEVTDVIVLIETLPQKPIEPQPVDLFG